MTLSNLESSASSSFTGSQGTTSSNTCQDNLNSNSTNAESSNREADFNINSDNDEDDDSGSDVSSLFEHIHDQAQSFYSHQAKLYNTNIDNNTRKSLVQNLKSTDRLNNDFDHSDSYNDGYEDDQFLFQDAEKQGSLKKRKSQRRCAIYWVIGAVLVMGMLLVAATFWFNPSAVSMSSSSSNSSSSVSQSSPSSALAATETETGTTPSSSTAQSKPLIPTSPDSPGYGKPVIDPSKRLFTMKDWRGGSLRPSFESLEWVAAAPGNSETSVHLLEENNQGFVLVDWPDRSNRTVLFENSQRAFKFNNTIFVVSRFVLSPDRKNAILIANSRKNYRHSSFANYFVYNIKNKIVKPLYTGHATSEIAIAYWSPLADKIAFVLDNNLFIRVIKDNGESPANDDKDEIKQITKDGGSEIFYGRPDWVYEEEVFASDTAMWWSPNGDYLAYLRTNDSSVHQFPIPYFVQKSPPSNHPYPQLTNIKYPKPGTPNPNVDLILLETKSFESYQVPIEENEAQDTEKLITEVVWTGDHNVIMRMSDRDSSVLKVGVIDAKKRVGSIPRVVNASEDGGWFEISQNTHHVPADSKNNRVDDGYIDMNVIDGYNHLVYYSPVNSTKPKAVLTRGEWEVDGDQVAFNPRTNKVYFISTKKSSVERHVYSVNLDGSDLKALTNETEDGWYSASFSPDSRYAIVSYKGPKVPWQVVLDLEAENMWDSAIKLAQNDRIKNAIKEYELPEQIYSQVLVGTDDHNKDVFANCVEYRPPSFNESLKYPVLFYVYGGPVSQLVQKTFAYGFQQALASTLNAIVVTVDGRGTGYRGRAYRNVVREHLGRYEAQDQIAAAKNWTSRKYVDPERVAIWGWSYGGFMTLKTLETDGGETFKYGMAVAPVTDWRFYDSIYTERYMRLPGADQNEKGYDESAITDVRKISQNKRFLVMHGTGDDNVHFQHTLTLLDKLDLDRIENYDVHVFPDSDHSIYYHGANTIVYDKLLHWISDAFTGKFLNFLKKRSQIP